MAAASRWKPSYNSKPAFRCFAVHKNEHPISGPSRRSTVNHPADKTRYHVTFANGNRIRSSTLLSSCARDSDPICGDEAGASPLCSPCHLRSGCRRSSDLLPSRRRAGSLHGAVCSTEKESLWRTSVNSRARPAQDPRPRVGVFGPRPPATGSSRRPRWQGCSTARPSRLLGHPCPE
jgi:hypothetical protein